MAHDAAVSKSVAQQWKAQGNTLLGQGRIEAAAQCYAQAAKADPQDPFAHVNLGYALLEMGRAAQAIESFSTALVVDPGCVDAHYLLAQACASTGSRARAAQSLRKAVSLKPDFDFAWRDLATLLEQDRDLQGALQAWDDALASMAGFPDALAGRSRILLRLGRPGEACAAALELARSQPALPFLLTAAEVLHEAGQMSDALQVVEHAVTRFPDDPNALQWQAQLLLESDQPAEALPLVRQVVALQPDSPHALNALGTVLYCLGQWDEAVEALSRAAAGRQPDGGHLYNLGCAYLSRNEPAAVIAVADRGLAMNPEDADLRWLRAVSSLLLGDMPRGWADYEWRWHRRRGAGPTTPVQRAPEWRGEALRQGTRLLVHCEQALGDSIQFLRFVPLLLEKGAQLVLSLQPSVLPLAHSLARSPGITVIGQDDPHPAVDLQCSLMSLPLLLGITMSTLNGRAYLEVDPALRAEWLQRLGPADRLRIGLVWSGNPKPDPNRSMALADLLTVLPPELQLVSLQKEVRDSDLPALRARPDLLHFGAELRSFADTAALADCMDLVLCIDTSVAHLVGAIGKRMWVFLPYVPDWRWLLDREDSPWYDCATLLRQDASRTWKPVLASLPVRLQAAGLKGPASA